MNGHAGFWRAVAWIYANTRGNGKGLPASATFPESSPRLTACLASETVAQAVQTESELASRAGIEATPTVKVLDRQSGRSIVLAGAVDGDALLSAMDALAAESSAAAAPRPTAAGRRPLANVSSDSR